MWEHDLKYNFNVCEWLLVVRWVSFVPSMLFRLAVLLGGGGVASLDLFAFTFVVPPSVLPALLLVGGANNDIRLGLRFTIVAGGVGDTVDPFASLFSIDETAPSPKLLSGL